ncbi:MAG: hypothetical protein AB7G21_13890 [Dehalococcoidia bacterium]
MRRTTLRHRTPFSRGLRAALSAAAIALAVLGATAGAARADVVITPGTATASRATNGLTGSGDFTEVSTIVIAEGLPGDFPSATRRTVMITAPPGWEFRPGPLSTEASTLAGITSIEAVADASMVTLTYSAIPSREVDVVRIDGLFARPVTGDLPDGDATGRGTNGTATVDGLEGAAAVTLSVEVGPGTFAGTPAFSVDNLAQAVFNGGTVPQLAAALAEVGATGAWAQDVNGRFVPYVVNGGFVNDPFLAAFPNGVPGPIAVTVVRGGIRANSRA